MIYTQWMDTYLIKLLSTRSPNLPSRADQPAGTPPQTSSCRTRYWRGSLMELGWIKSRLPVLFRTQIYYGQFQIFLLVLFCLDCLVRHGRCVWGHQCVSTTDIWNGIKIWQERPTYQDQESHVAIGQNHKIPTVWQWKQNIFLSWIGHHQHAPRCRSQHGHTHGLLQLLCFGEPRDPKWSRHTCPHPTLDHPQ